MNTEGRTVKSLRNSTAALVFYAANLLISFISRKVFIDHLGPEVLGLNTTAASLLQFLNLAELGIGTAIGVTLYKPLAEKDQLSINEIVSLQGWFYRKVAWVIIAAACILMLFFPKIFAGTDLPLWYAYGSFGVMLFGALIGYFVNYKQIVLSANQQQYQITRTYSSALLVKVIVQMLAVSVFKNGFFWWLVLEFVFAILSSWFLNWQIQKTCPELITNTKDGYRLRKKYPDVLKKIKQLFIHKISTFALTQTSPLIIYAYASLTMVTEYTNYVLITTSLLSLFNAIFNGMNAGVGNLVAEGEKTRINRVFQELFSIRFLLIATVSFCYFQLATPFVSIWLGPEHMLPKDVILMVTFLFFIRGTREVVDSFINAYGLFFDIWAPATEAILNVGLSILLGYYWGLTGILGGVLISQILIIFIWKPILLYQYGFRQSITGYVILYAKHLVVFALTILAVKGIFRLISVDPAGGFGSFFLGGTLMTILFVLILGTLQFVTEQGTRDFADRMWNQVLRKRA